jgi:predicted O-linked N-acetylglucosamine transferase (SPINDLY family)
MSQYATKLAQVRSLINDKPEQARVMCQRLVQVAPRDPWVQATMSRVMLRLGNTVQGLQYAQRAAELAPNEPILLVAHAELLAYEGQAVKALEVLERAVAIAPTDITCAVHHALALQRIERYAEAEAACRRGLGLDPRHGTLQSLLSGVLVNLGRIEEAVDVARAACEAHPEDHYLASSLAFMLNYRPGATPQEVIAAHRNYGEVLDRTDPIPVRRFTNSRDPERRLRIGLLSPDFLQHSVAYFIEPWLEHFCPQGIELVVYHTNRMADAITARLKTMVLSKGGSWHVMDNISDGGLAEKIFADRIDILMELSGHTHLHSLVALHRRPAPVQVTYLGYPNTTGLRQVDYRLVDSISDPPGAADALATERLARLDPCFLCYKPPADAPDCRTDSASNRPITFGSFNTLQKINRSLVAFWARLLQSVPGSRLVLKAGPAADASLRESAMARFAAAGLDPARVEFLPRVASVTDHLALYGLVDVALDTFPYNGTTTTCEALYMGVPVVTLAGNMHPGRVGASLLTCVGLGDLVAHSEEEYLAIAQRLAADQARRADLRTRLRGMVLSSPLCDAPAFAKRLDEAFRRMWRSWCEGY